MRFRNPVIAAVVVAACLFGMTAAGAASRPSVTPTIALASPPGATPTQPRLGTAVTFVTTYGTGVKNPSISINCYQGDALVWGDTGGVSDVYKLGGYSSAWVVNGGVASCTAWLLDITWAHKTQQVSILATTTFTAQG